MLYFLYLIPFLILSCRANTQEASIHANKQCSSTLQVSPRCTPCTLTQWAAKILTLKERPIELSTLPQAQAYQQSILTAHEFLTALRQCAYIMRDTMCDQAQWLGRRSTDLVPPEMFNLTRLPIDLVHPESNFTFKPYVQRLIVPTTSKIAFFGDFHGSAHSLMRDLLKLQAHGFINDSFKISCPNGYIIFLGDYTDRGIYGTECLYTVARLKIANPKQVFFVRGNHEDYMLQSQFEQGYFTKREKNRAPSFLLELDWKFSLTPEQKICVFRFYDVLPLVLYLGCGTRNYTNFFHCCHGGFELGYNPICLLRAPNTINFELITQFQRKRYFTHKLSKTSQNDIKVAFDIDALYTQIRDLTFPTPYFKDPYTQRYCYTGFMWNDFYVDPLKTVGHRDDLLRGWVYGKKLAEELLTWGTSKATALRGIIRAHQHNNETGGPMLNLLCCTKGLVDVWGIGTVFTLVSAPESKLETTSGENCFTYDSFMLLTVDEQFMKWKMDHYFQDRGFERKYWQHKNIPFIQRQSKKPVLLLQRKLPTQRESIQENNAY